MNPRSAFGHDLFILISLLVKKQVQKRHDHGEREQPEHHSQDIGDHVEDRELPVAADVRQDVEKSLHSCENELIRKYETGLRMNCCVRISFPIPMFIARKGISFVL